MPVYENIIEWIESGKYQETLTEIDNMSSKEPADALAVLRATVYERMGDSERLFEVVRDGLSFNPGNGELYYILGNYYSLYNANQAYLCYENACYYLPSEEDKQVVREQMEELSAGGKVTVKPTSIVILSYNTLEYTRQCIQSIRDNCARESYELVVVDNASDDGSAQWLSEQTDIVFVGSETNDGFPRGCNIGVGAASSANDILFLNSDTVLVENSLFYLRLALYSEETVGAAGSITSMAGNWQMIEEHFDTLEGYLEYGRNNNIPEKNAVEKRVKLSGFAMLVKRDALNLTGLFDERFSPGNYEDDDLSIRLMQAGYFSVVCHNSFIFHYGSISFGKEKEKYVGIVERNRDKFKDKWGFETQYYSHCRNYIFELMKETDSNAPLQILDVGCGLGATMMGIQFRYPEARVYGVELNGEVARLADKILDVMRGDIENVELPYADGQFDYIIFSDVLEHLRNPETVLGKMRKYLKSSGLMLASIPNVMHISVLEKMIKGTLAYQESGILDRTHLRFFTLDTILQLADESGLSVREVIPSRNTAEEGADAGALLDAIRKLNGTAERDRFLTYQYHVAFSRKEQRERAAAPKGKTDRKRKMASKSKQLPYADKKLLVYQVTSPYGALQYFMGCLLSAFHSFGVKTTVVNLDEKDALEQIAELSGEPFDAVLSFNCFISGVKLPNGKYLQDYIDAPYYYFLLDHPMHHHAALKETLKNFHALCVDHYFVDYIKTYYPHFQSVHMIPHGGCCKGERIAYSARKIDVLFTGTYKPCDELLQLMEDSDELASKISLAFAQEILSHPELRQEEAFANVLQNLEITVSKEQFAEWLSVTGNLVDHYVRGIYRNRLLEAMAGEDFRVEVYGEGWEKCTIEAENIHYHPAVDFEENLELMNQAKIVINTYTGFKSGAHERVFSTMLSGALCLSERNAYLEQLFTDGQEIVFFEYSDMEDFTGLLHRYLSDTEQSEQITERAYDLVIANHTWRERAQEIMQIITG